MAPDVVGANVAKYHWWLLSKRGRTPFIKLYRAESVHNVALVSSHALSPGAKQLCEAVVGVVLNHRLRRVVQRQDERAVHVATRVVERPEVWLEDRSDPCVKENRRQSCYGARSKIIVAIFPCCR